MNTWYALLFAGFFITSFSTSLVAQPSSLEKIFVLGGDEQQYERLSSTYTQTLLEVAGDDFQLALNRWFEIQLAMEDHATRVNFDLKGVKLFMQFYFAADGRIDYLGFIPQTDSRNVPLDEVRAFLAGFAAQYIPSFSSTRPFTHATSATFPTRRERKQ